MDLLERYLQAVGQYLPEATRQDTLAELCANLQAQMDDRAEELGRPLNDGDMVAMLKAHGKPEAVALRYLPQRSLIGPKIFPFYMMTLRSVTPFVVFVSAIVKGIEFVSWHHESTIDAMVGFTLGLVPSLLVTVAVITVIFAAIEWLRSEGKLGVKWNEWNPMDLPSVKTHAVGGCVGKPMMKRVIDLVMHCLWMAYVLTVRWHPFLLIGPGVFYLDKIGVGFAPVWHVFYALLVVLLTVQLGMKLLALTPGPHAWMKSMYFATNVLGVVALAIVVRADQIFVATSATTNLQTLAQVNHSVGLAMRIALVIAVVGLINDGWKLVRKWTPARRLAF